MAMDPPKNREAFTSWVKDHLKSIDLD